MRVARCCCFNFNSTIPSVSHTRQSADQVVAAAAVAACRVFVCICVYVAPAYYVWLAPVWCARALITIINFELHTIYVLVRVCRVCVRVGLRVTRATSEVIILIIFGNTHATATTTATTDNNTNNSSYRTRTELCVHKTWPLFAA